MEDFLPKESSRWFLKRSEGGSVGLPITPVIGANVATGAITLYSPKGERHLLSYTAPQVSVGVDIKVPMKIPNSRILGLSVKRFHKPLRRAINKTVEGATNLKNSGETYADDDINDALPDWIHPDYGTIYVGAGCKQDELVADDFTGGCVLLGADAGLMFGSKGTIMLAGLDKIPMPRPHEPIAANTGATTGWFVRFEDAVIQSFEATAVGQIELLLIDLLHVTKAILLFGGADVEIRAGGALNFGIGRATCVKSAG